MMTYVNMPASQKLLGGTSIRPHYSLHVVLKDYGRWLNEIYFRHQLSRRRECPRKVRLSHVICFYRAQRDTILCITHRFITLSATLINVPDQLLRLRLVFEFKLLPTNALSCVPSLGYNIMDIFHVFLMYRSTRMASTIANSVELLTWAPSIIAATHISGRVLERDISNCRRCSCDVVVHSRKEALTLLCIHWSSSD